MPEGWDGWIAAIALYFGIAGVVFAVACLIGGIG